MFHIINGQRDQLERELVDALFEPTYHPDDHRKVECLIARLQYRGDLNLVVYDAPDLTQAAQATPHQ